MNKLVSKNPILRFKLGRKIPKAQGGVWDTVKNYGKKALDYGSTATAFLAGGPYYGTVAYGTKEGIMKPAYNYGKELVKKAYDSAKDWVLLTPDGAYLFGGDSNNSSYKVPTKRKSVTGPGSTKRGMENAIKLTSYITSKINEQLDKNKSVTKKTSKPRSGWSYGYNRSNEISDIKATQQMLKDAGYLFSDKYDVVDGKWGKDTENAYKKYLLNKENPVVAPTLEEILQVLPLIAQQAQPTLVTQTLLNLTPKLTNFTPLRTGTFNKSQIRNLISEKLGQNAYNYTGAQRRALRKYLNGESDDTSLLDGTDLARFTLPFRKLGGRLISRNPIKRFKQGGISSFGKAFRKARAAGLKEFEWNGKKYHTRTKEEEDIVSKPKTETSSPAPIRKQSSDISPDTLKYRLQKDDFYFGGFKDGLSNDSFKKALPKSYKAGYNDSKKK